MFLKGKVGQKNDLLLFVIKIMQFQEFTGGTTQYKREHKYMKEQHLQMGASHMWQNIIDSSKCMAPMFVRCTKYLNGVY